MGKCPWRPSWREPSYSLALGICDRRAIGRVASATLWQLDRGFLALALE